MTGSSNTLDPIASIFLYFWSCKNPNSLSNIHILPGGFCYLKPHPILNMLLITPATWWYLVTPTLLYNTLSMDDLHFTFAYAIVLIVLLDCVTCNATKLYQM